MSTIEVKPTIAPDGLKYTPSAQAALLPTITVDPTGTFPSGSNFNPQTITVSAGSQITLQSAVSNLTAKVYTYSGGTSISAFTSGAPPYDASPSGTTYTLAVTGTITISLQSSPPSAKAGAELTDPKNGTINVGSSVSPGPH